MQLGSNRLLQIAYERHVDYTGLMYQEKVKRLQQ